MLWLKSLNLNTHGWIGRNDDWLYKIIIKFIYFFLQCRSRGFGFVAFDMSDCVDKLQDERPHVLDGKEVDTKRVIPKVGLHVWYGLLLYFITSESLCC